MAHGCSFLEGLSVIKDICNFFDGESAAPWGFLPFSFSVLLEGGGFRESG